MNWKNDDDLLAFDVKFALSQCRYRPPPRFNVDNPDAASRYHDSVARAIRDHLKLSWEFKKRPPRQ